MIQKFCLYRRWCHGLLILVVCLIALHGLRFFSGVTLIEQEGLVSLSLLTLLVGLGYLLFLSHKVERQVLPQIAGAQELAAIPSLSNYGFVLIDKGQRIIWNNEGFAKFVSGQQPLQNAPLFDLLDLEKSDPATVAKLRVALKLGSHFQGEVRLGGLGRREVIIDLELQPLRGRDANSASMFGVANDVTSRRLLEDRIACIFEAIAEGIVVQDFEGRIFDCNPAAETILGLSRDQILGRTSIDPRWHAIHEDGTQWPGIDHPAMETLRTRQPIRGAIMGLRIPDQPLRWIAINTQLVSNLSGSRSAVVASFTDVTQQREQIKRLDLTISGAGLGVWDWNPRSDQTWFNDRWWTMLGYQPNELPSVGATYFSLLHPEDADRVAAELAAHVAGKTEEYRAECRLRCKDGSWRWIISIGRIFERDSDGNPTRISGVHLDEHERRQMAVQIAQGQRIESMGHLAAGVAHEINSPMQFIGDNIEYVAEGMQSALRLIELLETELIAAVGHPDARQRIEKFRADTGFDRYSKNLDEALADCREGCQRVTLIVRAMRQLSHPGDDIFHGCHLNQIITGASIVTRNKWRYLAETVLDLDETLPMIECREAELSQVMVNLFINAADAIAELHGPEPAELGTISVSTKRRGDWVRVVFRDTGCGIPSQNLPKIFDCFFTTKPVGVGTGQGLTLAYDIIVKKHNGEMRVESEVGQGTTFTIDLPLSQNQKTHATQLASAFPVMASESISER